MESTFLLQLGLILIMTKLLSILSRKFHLPQVVGALVAGLILGPAILNFVHEGEVIESLAEVGVILLMFTAGLETDLKQLMKSIKPALVIAILGQIFPVAGGFLISRLFGFELLHSIFIGVIIMSTSISLSVEVLKEMGKLKTKAGTAILSAAVLDDIIAVIILSFFLQFASGDGSVQFGEISLMLFNIAIFFAISLIAAFVVKRLFDYLEVRYSHTRRLAIFSLAFCFLMAYFAEYLGVADITGAYLAGLALCSTRAEEYIEHKTEVLSYLFFSPIFFVSIGLNVTFEHIAGETLLFAAFLLLITIIAKLIGAAIGAKVMGYTKKESIQIAMGMIARGEVSLIVLARGTAVGLVATHLFSSIVIVILLTTLISPILLKLVFKDKEAMA